MSRLSRLSSFQRQARRCAAPAAIFSAGVALGFLVVATTAADRHDVPETTPAAPSAAPAVGRYAADIVRVIDGDTFEARVHVWPGFDLTTRVRLRGIDAPELRARCADERARAESALDGLRAILAEREVTIWAVGPDKYFGRIVADAGTRRTPNVAAALREKGLARDYAGGRRESWCDS